MRNFLILSISLSISINFTSTNTLYEQMQFLSPKDKMEYIKLEELKFEFISIARNEEIELLSFSGGKICKNEYTVYKQFIGIRKLTGDTVRILAACQTYKSSKLNKIGYFIEDYKNPLINRDLISKKLVAFNRRYFKLEKGNYKTCIGGLGFPVE